MKAMRQFLPADFGSDSKREVVCLRLAQDLADVLAQQPQNSFDFRFRDGAIGAQFARDRESMISLDATSGVFGHGVWLRARGVHDLDIVQSLAQPDPVAASN